MFCFHFVVFHLPISICATRKKIKFHISFVWRNVIIYLYFVVVFFVFIRFSSLLNGLQNFIPFTTMILFLYRRCLCVYDVDCVAIYLYYQFYMPIHLPIHTYTLLWWLYIIFFFAHIKQRWTKPQMLISKASASSSSTIKMTKQTNGIRWCYTHSHTHSYTSLINFIVIAPFHIILNSLFYFSLSPLRSLSMSSFRKANKNKIKKNVYMFSA